jgi:hypothetical protein
MTRKVGRGRFLCTLVLLSCLAGCKGLFGSQGLPKDPLFLDRKPVEVKARLAPPIAIAYSEPSPPANPYLARRTQDAVNGTLTNRPRTDPPEEQDEP